MKSNTLFGHIAVRLSTRTENLATEALGFILKNSPAASRAFSEFICLAGIACPETLRFDTQQAELENSIPDMKCRDDVGRLRVIVENKFWAGLTDNQPVTYIQGLAPGVPGVVLFIVPDARLRLVWDELVNRCRAAEIPVSDVRQHTSITVGVLSDQHFIAIASWGNLLRTLATATSSAGETDSHGDIAQLQGLCKTMDEEAFLPLRGDELTDLEMARRIINYSNLPFDIASAAESRGYCNRKGLRETPFRYGSGTYIRIGAYQPWLGFDAEAWSRHGMSPLWVNFPLFQCNPIAEIRDKLVRFRTAEPARCFDFNNGIVVPILLTAGVEKHRIVEDAVMQLGDLVTELGVQAQSASSGE